MKEEKNKKKDYVVHIILLISRLYGYLFLSVIQPSAKRLQKIFAVPQSEQTPKLPDPPHLPNGALQVSEVLCNRRFFPQTEVPRC